MPRSSTPWASVDVPVDDLEAGQTRQSDSLTHSFSIPLQDEAHNALRRHWRVIALHAPVTGSCSCGNPSCNAVGKHPLAKWKGLPHPDPDFASQWFAKPLPLSLAQGIPTPPNLGIVTGPESGIVVIDVDPRNFGDDTLHDLERLHGELPNTPQVLTGGDGVHFYFACPPGRTLACGVLAEGIDFKADGGYVVGPGSLHKSGGSYIWEVESHPDDVPLAELPAWVIDMVAKPKTPFRGKRGDGKPRSVEEQEAFSGLWLLAGITFQPGDAMYCCVFHDDRTPSLHIDSERCLWHCFGCGVGGGTSDLSLLLSASPLVRVLRPTSNSDIGLLNITPTSWPAPTPPSGTCHLPQVHRNHTDRPAHRALAVLCGNWRCGTCGPYHKAEWLQHLALTISATRQQSVMIESESGWQATYKALRRAGDDYVVFDLKGLDLLGGTGELLVIASGTAGQVIDHDEAQKLLADVVRALPFDSLRISTSRTWSLGSGEAAGSAGEWENLGQARRPLRELSTQVEGFGWQPEPLKTTRHREGRVRGTAVAFRVPDDEVDTPTEQIRMAEVVA